MSTMTSASDASAAKSSVTAMTDESDADLLQYVSWRTEYPDEAQEAFLVFHARHAEFLFKKCCKLFGAKLPTYYTVEDLVGDTFARVLERVETFNAKGEKDVVRLRRLARAWMFRIAYTILMDVYRGRTTLETTIDPDVLELLAADDPPDDSPRVRLAERAVKEVLDDREWEVLRVTLHWYKVGEKNQRLPNDIAADLAKTLGTTSDNLRKIRATALRKVKEFILKAEAEPADTE